MTRRGANPALAALASLAALLGLTTLVVTQTWYARTIWFVFVAVGIGALIRRFVSRSGWLIVPAQVLGSLAIGPQQRVVTVQVGEGDEAVRLVLGVSAQQIQCLHVLNAQSAYAQVAQQSVANASGSSSFTESLIRAQAGGSARNSGDV